MLRAIDRLINATTMYRLVLYYLGGLLLLGLALSAAGVLPVDPVGIITTTVVLLAVSMGTNLLFSRLLGVWTNQESSIITALILALIAGPVSVTGDLTRLGIIALAGVFAIASKYVLVLHKQHIFNPAALGIFLTGIIFGEYASWWVGNAVMLPAVIAGGILVLRKISRFRFVGIFLGLYALFVATSSLSQGLPLPMVLQSFGYVFLHTEVIFLAVVMLTEPITSPGRFHQQVFYLAIVAFFLLPTLTIFGMSFSPAEALLLGNIFSFVVSRNRRLVLPLSRRVEHGGGITTFAFPYPQGFNHKVGQYMEWTLPLASSDNRGNRRYFSIASAPSEEELLVTARFYDRSSSYKEHLAAMEPGDTIIASELSGDFVLPSDASKPLAFIAGGIGITPFRSMIKHLVDTGEKRDIVLLYSNYGPEEMVFCDLFQEAQEKVGVKTVHTLTDPERVPADWKGETGFIDSSMITTTVPRAQERLYMVSGSPAFVEHMKAALRKLGVRRNRIRTDYFPGYA